MFARQNQYSKAREVFSKGLLNDYRCAPLYHAAALLEAKLGNLAVNKILQYLVYLFYLNKLPFGLGLSGASSKSEIALR